MTQKEMKFMIKFYSKLEKPSKRFGFFPRIQAQYKLGIFPEDDSNITESLGPGWLITADWRNEKTKEWKEMSVYLEDE